MRPSTLISRRFCERAPGILTCSSYPQSAAFPRDVLP